MRKFLPQGKGARDAAVYYANLHNSKYMVIVNLTVMTNIRN